LRTFTLLLSVGVIALICGASLSLATTAPSQHYDGLVKITNTEMKLFEFVGYNDQPQGDLVPTQGPIPRGDNMSITIVNNGKRTQDFTILGHTTAPIKPGHQGHLSVVFSHRGTFSYGSTLDKAPKFHGVIRVY
jgi:hypothetical protein